MLRILHLHPRQLQAWERAGLVASRDNYSFEELGQLRALRDLQARQLRTRITARSIRAYVDAMQRVAGMSNPLLETSAVRYGSRVAFRHLGALVNPITQQLAFDFETAPKQQMRLVRNEPQAPGRDATGIQEIFLRAVHLEDQPGGLAEAVALYESILELHPAHAPALINLGTIHYNKHEFDQAETLYRRATVADPEYALAFFDLGNVLDEMLRLTEAIEAYQRAVTLVPQYADAHYNLALAYERLGERRRSLRHWQAYARLDPAGPWSDHARDQARRILRTEKLVIVSRRGQLTDSFHAS